MFKKVLIAEDFQDANLGIIDTLRERLHITEAQEELYCDRALSRLKVALAAEEPFELLVTDLHFKKDHVTQRISSGIELITAARLLQPGIKVIVNSMEDNPIKINALFKDQKIDGYVCKGRHGLNELVSATKEVYHNRTYYSPQINLNIADNVFELDDYDLKILKALAAGLTKKEVSEKFKKENISPSSESTIDKRISRLYDEYRAKNTTNLLFKLVKEGKI
ncbi:DNA-binding response regulator [Aurantibacter sp.]|uniref:DNA-binding response regulator n=1 Tax=Aurantibacter sp. TaxID=2807103 RepID=UPI003265D064